jgi:hypothetical protein
VSEHVGLAAVLRRDLEVHRVLVGEPVGRQRCRDRGDAIAGEIAQRHHGVLTALVEPDDPDERRVRAGHVPQQSGGGRAVRHPGAPVGDEDPDQRFPGIRDVELSLLRDGDAGKLLPLRAECPAGQVARQCRQVRDRDEGASTRAGGLHRPPVPLVQGVADRSEEFLAVAGDEVEQVLAHADALAGGPSVLCGRRDALPGEAVAAADDAVTGVGPRRHQQEHDGEQGSRDLGSLPRDAGSLGRPL